MNRGEIKELIRETATEVVKQNSVMMGVPADPIEAQKERAALRELTEMLTDDEFRQDLMHLRKWRKAMDSVQSKGTVATIGFICMGGIAFILYAFGVKFPTP